MAGHRCGLSLKSFKPTERCFRCFSKPIGTTSRKINYWWMRSTQSPSQTPLTLWGTSKGLPPDSPSPWQLSHLSSSWEKLTSVAIQLEFFLAKRVIFHANQNTNNSLVPCIVGLAFHNHPLPSFANPMWHTRLDSYHQNQVDPWDCRAVEHTCRTVCPPNEAITQATGDMAWYDFHPPTR